MAVPRGVKPPSFGLARKRFRHSRVDAGTLFRPTRSESRLEWKKCVFGLATLAGSARGREIGAEKYQRDQCATIDGGGGSGILTQIMTSAGLGVYIHSEFVFV
jgi:hypothetical protein